MAGAFQELFLASQATASTELHDSILLRYLAIIHPTLPTVKKSPGTSSKSSSVTRPRLDDLVRVLGSGEVRPSAHFWSPAFDLEASLLDPAPGQNDGEAMETQHDALELKGVRAILEILYVRWRDSFTDRGQSSSPHVVGAAGGRGRVQTDAGLRYAEWLLRVADDGATASTVIQGALAVCSSEPTLRDEVERRWGDVLAAHEAASAVTSAAEGQDVDIDIILD